MAGKKEGGDEGSGTSSSLMYETLQIITRLKQRPKYVIWENVKGLLSHMHEHNYKKYLNIMRELGYKNYSKVLYAKDYNIPQNRPRSFVISILNNDEFEFPNKKLLTHSYKEYLLKNYSDDVILEEQHRKKVKGCPEYSVNYSFGGSVVEGDVFPTITKSYKKANGNGGTILCDDGKTYRTLEAKECWRLQGFDDEDFERAAKVNSETQLRYQAGNSIAVPVLEALLNSLFHKDSNRYRIYRYHPIINYIVQALLTTKNRKFNDKGNPYSEIWTEYGTVIITINNYDELKNYLCKTKSKKGLVNQSTVRVLEMILIELSEEGFTSQNSKKIDIDTREFIKLQGKDKNNQTVKANCNRQIREAIEFLQNISIEFLNKKISDIKGICKSTTELQKHSNTLHVILNDTLNKLLTEEGTDISIPLEILQIDEKKHPNTYLLYKKILSKLGRNKSIVIQVKELYEYCTTLQRYEKKGNDEIAKKNRKPNEKIIIPFERDLTIIKEFKWKYETTNSKKWKTIGKNDRTGFDKWLETNIIISRRKKIKINIQQGENKKFKRVQKHIKEKEIHKKIIKT